MKKARKIIPALAMLLVSAIMMSTASFAWFTLSNQVTVSGMQVTAKSNGGLVIAYAAKGSGTWAVPAQTKYSTNAIFDSANDWYNGASQIMPVSNSKGTDNWFYGEAAVADNAAVNGEGFKAIPSAPETYYYKTVLFIKSLDDTDTPHTLTVDQVTATPKGSGGSDLEKSVRVAVKVIKTEDDPATDGVNEEEATWLYFAPNSEDTATNLTYVSAVGAVANYTEADMHVGGAKFVPSVPFIDSVSVKNSVSTRVEVYVYFEGQDENCKSTFAYDLRALDISVKFSAA